MLRVLCSPTPAAFRDTRGLSDYLEFNHIIEHWLFCLSVNMWSEPFLVALFAHSCQEASSCLPMCGTLESFRVWFGLPQVVRGPSGCISHCPVSLTCRIRPKVCWSLPRMEKGPSRCWPGQLKQSGTEWSVRSFPLCTN